jgi:hypothetical protein
MSAYGRDIDTQIAPPAVGNFILPGSQQPGSFISFGQTLIGQNQTQLSLFTTDFGGSHNHEISLIPSIAHGITDQFTFTFAQPFAVDNQDHQNHSSGIGDSILQLEYAFYATSTRRFTDQATIVTSVSFPTGSTHQQPPTGFGSPTFFVGATFDRTYTDWFLFTSYGGLLTTQANNTQFGDQFLYQAGIGRNIVDIGTRWIFAWLVEADGEYDWPDKINGQTDPNSGGNTIFITPSLWVSSKHLIVQAGVGFPVVQHLFGDQSKSNYLLAMNLSWLF